MIIARPWRPDRMRRAFARMSTMLTLPASTMCSGASCRTSAAATTLVQSLGPTRLFRMRSHGTFASEQSSRMPISNRDISRDRGVVAVFAAGDVVDPLLGVVGDGVGFVAGAVGEVHDVGGRGDQSAAERGVGDDLR